MSTPKGELVDPKPKMDSKVFEMQDQQYTMTISAGQYMGLPFLLTYPAELTVVSNEAP
jgi:hypothetical protein